MKAGSKLKLFDKVALLSAAIAILSIGFVVLFSSQAGVRVSLLVSDVGPDGPLVLKFSEPVDASKTDSSFSVQPETQGRFVWVDSRTLHFIPKTPFQPDTQYKVVLEQGAIGESGSLLRRSRSWSFKIRPTLVMFFKTGDKTSELWTVNEDGNDLRKIISVTSRIYDFDSSPDGEFIVYSLFNDKNGIDLWMVDRNGNAPNLFLDCGADRCTTPAVSPDASSIAYTRETAGITSDLPPGAPRPWIVDIQNRVTRPVFEDSQIIGYGPTWSPDGRRLSSYDGLADIIRVVDLKTGQQFESKSAIGSVLTWSGDGTKMMFTDVADTPDGSRTQVKMIDFASSETGVFLGNQDDRDYFYSALAWSPVADEIVLGIRSQENSPEQELSIINIGTLEGSAFASDSEYDYGDPHWDPWGQAVLFQRFKLKSVYKSEILVWSSGLKAPVVVGEGLQPHWMP